MLQGSWSQLFSSLPSLYVVASLLLHVAAGVTIDGYLYGFQGICPNNLCWNVQLELKNISLPSGTGGPHDMGKVLPMNDRWTFNEFGRFGAYDAAAQRIYFIQQDGSCIPPYSLYLYRLFTIELGVYLKQKDGVLPVSNITLSFDLSNRVLSSIQFDQRQGVLYAMFDRELLVIDTATGNLKSVGAVWQNNSIIPQLTSAYDSDTGNYFSMVYDVPTGYGRLLTYNTYSKNSILTPPIAIDNKGFQSLPVMIQYYQATDEVVAVANGHLGGTLLAINYTTGAARTLVTTANFPNDEFDIMAPTPYYNQLSFLDQSTGYFWFNLQDINSEGGVLMYYPLQKSPAVCCYNYYSLANDFTNYIWVPLSANTSTSESEKPVPSSQAAQLWMDYQRSYHTKLTSATKKSASYSLSARHVQADTAATKLTGYFLSLLAQCQSAECATQSIDLFQIQLPTFKNYTDLVTLVNTQSHDITMSLGRISTFDATRNRYFVVIDKHLSSGRYTLYIANTTTNPLAVSSVVLDARFDQSLLSSIQYDNVTNKLFAVVNQSIYEINQRNGQGTFLADYVNLASNPWVLPNYYISTYDSVQGNYFISVYDLFDDYYKLVVFNTRSLTSTLSPPVGAWEEHDQPPGTIDIDKALYRAIHYYQPTDEIIAVADSNRWDGSIEAIDYHKGTWVDLLDRYTFPYSEFAIQPPSEVRNQLSCLDHELLWLSIQDINDMTDLIVYYNLTQRLNTNYALEGGQYLSADYTNYVYIENPVV